MDEMQNVARGNIPLPPSYVEDQIRRQVAQHQAAQHQQISHHQLLDEYPQKKNLIDIHNLMHCGVDVKVIAQVKNMNPEEIKKIIENNQFKQIQQLQLLQAQSPHLLSDPVSEITQQTINLQQPLIAPLMNMVNQAGGLQLHNFVPMPPVKKEVMMMERKQKKPRKKSWKESDFPPEHRGEYFCLDCNIPSRVRDCQCGRASWKWCLLCQKYQQPSYHFHFVQNRKKIRKKWKSEDFPTTKRGGIKEVYFCGDCKKENRLFDCSCGRKCWRWCDDCSNYKQATNHGHFVKHRKKKRKRWTSKNFPIQRLSKYYCLDCKKANDTRKCRCGRDGWRWCDVCVKYLSKSHYHFKKMDKKRGKEEMKIIRNTLPTLTNLPIDSSASSNRNLLHQAAISQVSRMVNNPSMSQSRVPVVVNQVGSSRLNQNRQVTHIPHPHQLQPHQRAQLLQGGIVDQERGTADGLSLRSLEEIDQFQQHQLQLHRLPSVLPPPNLPHQNYQDNPYVRMIEMELSEEIQRQQLEQLQPARKKRKLN